MCISHSETWLVWFGITAFEELPLKKPLVKQRGRKWLLSPFSVQAFHKWLMQVGSEVSLSPWTDNYTLSPNMQVLSERWMLVWWTLQVSQFFCFVLFLCVTWWKGKAKRTISFLARSLFCTTRYLHVLQPEAGAAAAGRRSSVPTVSSSSVPYALPNRRRGSEPALLQAELMSRRSEFVVNVSNHQHSVGHRAADIAEEQSQGIGCGNEWNFWSAFLHT